MNLHKLILTENACYKAGRKITVKGIMVHSTGANNPNLKRYVGPNDGLLGENQYGNHWNTYHPGGREVCVHAFIGKLADGGVHTLDDLADLAVDELTDITGQSADEAKALIMTARAHWFTDDAGDAAAPAATPEQ